MAARVGRRTRPRDTQRVDRDLDRPARELAAAEAVQGESGPALRGVVPRDEGRVARQ
jgi:hypothetical protein